MLSGLRMTVAYDGSAFFGFQSQVGVPTVQDELERALALVLGEKVRVHGSGRTDAGVHACGQVILVKTGCPIPIDKLIVALNGALRSSIHVKSIERSENGFHPRFSAKGKHYRYLFREVVERSPFLERFFFQVEDALDVPAMQAGAVMFLGEHDFSAFTRSPLTKENLVRTILEVRVEQKNALINFDVIGTGFLHNMVRNMAKALFLIGLHRMEPSEIPELYRNQNRRRLGAPAPAAGLYLMRVMY